MPDLLAMSFSRRATKPALSSGTGSPGRASSLPRLALVALVATAGSPIGLLTPPARAEQGIGEIVKAFCLSAFETEMEQAGKVPPAGMADYACGCMAERLQGGSSISTARAACRQETVSRYRM